MATLDELHSALVNADAAGDTEAATALATEIKRLGTPAPKVDPYVKQAQGEGGGQNFMAALGGAMYAPYLGIKQRLGLADQGTVDENRKAMSGLGSTASGTAGSIAGSAAVAAPLALVPGVNTLAGSALAGSALGAAQPTAKGESTLENAGLGALGGAVGQKVGGMIANGLASRAANKASSLAAEKTANTVRDATLAEAQAAGYALPPSQVSPTVTNRVLEGFAGKLTTAQQASAKNQSVTNNLIKREIGVPPDAPLSLDTIRAARQEAAQAYTPVRQFGEIEADKEYAHALNDIATKYDRGHGGMASLRNKEVEGLLDDAATLKIDSNNAVDFLQNLREQGFANASPLAKAADRKLGKTQLGIANAVEDLMDRKLAEAGQPDVLQAFRDARVRIAKTFTAEKALNHATGNIEASKIGAMFKKDKPLTGGFETVGKAAAAFPKALAENKTSMPGISPLDYLGGALGYGAAGPAAALGAFARPVVRSGILSGAYQRAMVQPPSYELSAAAKALPKVASAETTRALERMLGSYGLLGIAPKQ
jgi:hypothetical protein